MRAVQVHVPGPHEKPVTANDPVNLTGVSPVVTAMEITGDNTATWNPTIHIAVGANMAAGMYSGTITHSVS